MGSGLCVEHVAAYKIVEHLTITCIINILILALKIKFHKLLIKIRSEVLPLILVCVWYLLHGQITRASVKSLDTTLWTFFCVYGTFVSNQEIGGGGGGGGLLLDIIAYNQGANYCFCFFLNTHYFEVTMHYEPGIPCLTLVFLQQPNIIGL